MFRLPRRLLHGAAALLALALSAFGGSRLGIERVLAGADPDADRPAIAPAVVAVVAASASADAPTPLAVRPAPRAIAPTREREGSVPCALLLGCALGPRAP
jgi:hypothetical protein